MKNIWLLITNMYIQKCIAYFFVLFALLSHNSALSLTITLNVDQLYQNDYLDNIDSSYETIASFGCGITSETMIINYALKMEGLHKKNDDGSKGEILQYTPAEINTLLIEYRWEKIYYKKNNDGSYVIENGKRVVEKTETRNGYNQVIGDDGEPQGSSTTYSVGSLLKAIEQDTKEKTFEGKSLNQTKYYNPDLPNNPKIGANGEKLDKDFTFILDRLEEGLPVAVRVANDTHTVVVTSYHQGIDEPRGSGRYNILDPFRSPDGSSIRWLDHQDYNNLIYDYGAPKFRAGGSREPYAVPSEDFIEPEYIYDPIINPDQYGPQVLAYNHIQAIPEPRTIGFLILGFIVFFKLNRRLIDESK